MRTLKNYLNENIQTDLSDYIMIDEGLIRWIKRMWRRLFNSVKRNKRDHDGYYAPYKYMKDVVQNDFTGNQSNNSNSNNGNFSFDSDIYDQSNIKTLIKIIEELNTKDGTNPFSAALDYFTNQNNNQNKTTFLITVKNNDKIDYLCIIVGEKMENKFNIDEVFWNECVRKEYKIKGTFINDFVKRVVKNEIGGKIKDNEGNCLKEENIGPVEKFKIED